MMLAAFKTITSYTTLTAHGFIATIKHVVFQLFAMQLAAVLSAICLPIMVLDAVLRILGFSPLFKATDNHKDHPRRNKVTLVATSASHPPGSNRSRTVSSAKAAVEQGSPPKGYEQLTDHEARWLAAFYQEYVKFYSPYTIEPEASKAPAFQKKLDFVLGQKLAKRTDMDSLGFAKFVCKQKGLPYTGMKCCGVMITGEFLDLSPP